MAIFNIPHSIPIDLDTFGFVERERRGDKVVKNRCGRDFLYYALHYFFPKEYNPSVCGPAEIERKHIFGMSLLSFLVWTCLPFYKVPALFLRKNLAIRINNTHINSVWRFISVLFRRSGISVEQALSNVRSSVDRGIVSGIDISLGLRGLYDHVLFVVGYDEDNLYVIDTYQVKAITYEKLTPEGDNRFLMRLPISTLKSMWDIYSRVWTVEHSSPKTF